MKAFTVKVVLDRPRFLKRVAAKKKKVLYKQGGYLKTTMQRSMRYGGKKEIKSKPGEPPRAHKRTGALLRKLIGFVVDLVAGSVICGPEHFKGGSGGSSSKPLPQLLNEGGDVTFQTRFLDPRLVFIENIRTPTVTAHIAPRPFTAPVFSDGGKNFNQLIEGIPL